jgi:hypothetical protein
MLSPDDQCLNFFQRVFSFPAGIAHSQDDKETNTSTVVGEAWQDIRQVASLHTVRTNTAPHRMLAFTSIAAKYSGLLDHRSDVSLILAFRASMFIGRRLTKFGCCLPHPLARSTRPTGHSS